MWSYRGDHKDQWKQGQERLGGQNDRALDDPYGDETLGDGSAPFDRSPDGRMGAQGHRRSPPCGAVLTCLY
jgi:hypothetical protein